jgi:hypothetical protein
MGKRVTTHSHLSIHKLNSIHPRRNISSRMVNRSIHSSMGSLNIRSSTLRLAINHSR